jgi:transcriptional regulator with XRE-family HTH domain
MARWLRRVRLSNELEQDELAAIIKKSRSTVNMMERGDRTVRADVVAAILEAYPDSPTPPLGGDIAPTGTMSSKSTTIRWELPYAGIVPCSSDWGDPLEGAEMKPIDPDFTGPNRFICRVAGSSCYPALQEGDITVWESDKDPDFGVIVLAQRLPDSACTVKQLAWDDSRARPILRPVNTDHEAPDDGEGWEATARLIGVIRRDGGTKRTWLNEDGLRPANLIVS